MPVSDIKIYQPAEADFTITLASLANNFARQSDMIANASPGYPAALIQLQLKSNASAPTAGAVYEIYLLRSIGTLVTDGGGSSDAAITLMGAPMIGTIGPLTASTNTLFTSDVIDTTPFGPLGPSWGIAVRNTSGQALNATEGSLLKKYRYWNPEAQ